MFEAKLREQAGLRFAVVRQARLAEADRKVTDLLTAGATRLMQVCWACEGIHRGSIRRE